MKPAQEQQTKILTAKETRSPFPVDQPRIIHERWNPAYQPHRNLAPHAFQALLDGKVQCLFIALFENERPPQGLSTWVDHTFSQAITHAIRNNIATGQVGEAVLVPVLKNEKVYPVVLIGGGTLPIENDPAKKALMKVEFPEAGLQKILKTIKGLSQGEGFSKASISASDFLFTDPKSMEKKLKDGGQHLWITA